MTVTLESHLDPSGYRDALRADVSAGLTHVPKVLPPKWFYDERGSDLFDQITRLPEYYPTRTERSILLANGADEIAATSGADTLVEIGCGTSEKTRILLDAFAEPGTLRRFVPSTSTPCAARRLAAVARQYPGVQVHAVVGDFEQHLARLPRNGRRMVAFLGSTIGNLRTGPALRIPPFGGPEPAPGRHVPARHRPRQGAGKAGRRLRRLRRRHGRVQSQRAHRGEP